MRSYIHKYHNVRFAQVVKALVCAMCFWSIVQTACADEFRVNERITSKLQYKKITAYSWRTTCEIPVTDIIGSGNNIRTYCRLVLFDAKTQQPLYELSKTQLSPVKNPYNWLFQQTDKGLIEFPRYTGTRTPENVTLTKPEGYKWKDIYVGMYYVNLNSNNKETEREIAKRLGINGNIDLVPAITSDPNYWDGFCLFQLSSSASLESCYLPYEGISQPIGDFETNVAGLKRQKAHTWEYTYYVKRQANNKITLKRLSRMVMAKDQILNMLPIGVGMITIRIVTMQMCQDHQVVA